MKKIILSTLAAAFAVSLSSVAFSATTLDDLLKTVRNEASIQERLNKEREAKFRADRRNQQRLLADAKSKLANENAISERQKTQFDTNEGTITKLTEELRIKQGNLGELFGVVRQSANSMSGDLSASVVSAQYPGREVLLNELNDAGTPSMAELRDFWVLMLQEMTEQGKSTSFTADVVNTEGRTESQTIKRVGAFNLIKDGEYLIYDGGQIKTLQVQPSSKHLTALSAYESAGTPFAGLFVDPTKGGVLQLEKLKMGLPERLWKYKGIAGWAVLVLLILGILISFERFVSLYLVTGPAIHRQKKSATPTNNPLGRIMKVYMANKNEDTENLELKLDEAVLKETPKIERGINLIKVIAALGPLLGLLGTVTGMIEVFQAITLKGTGDPRIMADGISAALATTVWGLLAAIPLTFLHAVVSGKSKNIIHTLEEQSTGLMAQHEEKSA